MVKETVKLLRQAIQRCRMQPIGEAGGTGCGLKGRMLVQIRLGLGTVSR
jgi:hypothetical protein